jgi:hypothetical protein
MDDTFLDIYGGYPDWEDEIFYNILGCGLP